MNLRINPVLGRRSGGLNLGGRVKAAIDKKDGPQFEKAYRGALKSCYQCHKAVGRPSLRPMISKSLPQTMINLDARANWPQ